MPKYIDVDELKEWVENWLYKDRYYHNGRVSKNIPIPELYDILEQMPTADVFPVVRCKDCLHYENGFCYNPNTYDDEKTRGNTIPNWFCADGKRKTDD